MSKEKIKILLVGVGGFASYFWEILHEKVDQEAFEVVAVVDPYRREAACYPQIKAKSIPEYDLVEEFFSDSENVADLAVILSPHHFHKEQSICCLKHGVNVLCEKPAAPLLSDLDEMIKVAEEENKLLGIGFQWSFLPEIQAMKKDIMNQRFGRLLFAKTMVCWPRNTEYYSNSWRGMIKNAKGEYVLDSVLANTTAHYLHNLLYLAGDSWNRAASADALKVSLYRAKKIQNYDTVSLEATLPEGQKIVYLSSVAVDEAIDPLFEISCEKGRFGVDRNSDDQRFYAEDIEGRREYYGEKPDNDLMNAWKIIRMIEAVQEFKRSGIIPEIACDGITSRPHLEIMNRLAFGAEIYDFPAELIKEYDDERLQGQFVPGLSQALYTAYKNNQLLSASQDFGLRKESSVKKLKDLS